MDERWIKLPLIGLLRLRVKVGDSWEWSMSDGLGEMSCNGRVRRELCAMWEVEAAVWRGEMGAKDDCWSA